MAVSYKCKVNLNKVDLKGGENHFLPRDTKVSRRKIQSRSPGMEGLQLIFLSFVLWFRHVFCENLHCIILLVPLSLSLSSILNHFEVILRLVSTHRGSREAWAYHDAPWQGCLHREDLWATTVGARPCGMTLQPQQPTRTAFLRSPTEGR